MRMNEMILNRKQTPIEIALDIDETGHTTARKLYAWLELRTGDYARWAKTNITDNAYAEEGKDYSALMRNEDCGRGNYAQDYLLSASFAKKLAMISKSPKGEETREYFVKVEDALVKATKPMTQMELALWSAQQLVEQERRMLALESHNEEQDARLDELDARTTTRPGTHYTIAGYWKLMKHPITVAEASTLGRKASAICKAFGYQKKKVTDEKFGEVGSYPVRVLKMVYEDWIHSEE